MKLVVVEVCISIRLSMYRSIYLLISLHTYIYINTYIYIYIYVYTYIYIYVYVVIASASIYDFEAMLPAAPPGAGPGGCGAPESRGAESSALGPTLAVDWNLRACIHIYVY